MDHGTGAQCKRRLFNGRLTVAMEMTAPVFFQVRRGRPRKPLASGELQARTGRLGFVRA